MKRIELPGICLEFVDKYVTIKVHCLIFWIVCILTAYTGIHYLIDDIRWLLDKF